MANMAYMPHIAPSDIAILKCPYGNDAAHSTTRFCHSAATSATTPINGNANATMPDKTTMLARRMTAGFIKMPTSEMVEKVFATNGIVAMVEAMPTIIIPTIVLTILKRVEAMQ